MTVVLVIIGMIVALLLLPHILRAVSVLFLASLAGLVTIAVVMALQQALGWLGLDLTDALHWLSETAPILWLRERPGVFVIGFQIAFIPICYGAAWIGRKIHRED